VLCGCGELLGSFGLSRKLVVAISYLYIDEVL
jgi:hypothetical protein